MTTRKAFLAALLLALSLTAAACENTVEGVGEDAEQNVEDANEQMQEGEGEGEDG